MRALLDYHHADLAESLHLLLEDRLGIECYVPVGPEWWTEGFWRFGQSTFNDDRLGQQFLNREAVEVDDAHPSRTHRVVTLAEALDLDWDYAVASVPDNYMGYWRFAQAVGARFVIQVGNTRQPVDWSLGPLVINTSEAPIQGRGVTVHQEFSLTDFHPAPIVNPRQVASFVNCMDRMPCWPMLDTARGLLADWEWRIHGIDGEHSNLKPTSAVADAMRAAGWAWHDKVTGDGFGHVIHNWAAVGRPLVGHRAHYVGQMGEALWVDGETCIDLDRHSVAEATGLMAEIAGTPNHERMAQAIRDTFAGLVDYEAEAEQVRELLA